MVEEIKEISQEAFMEILKCFMEGKEYKDDNHPEWGRFITRMEQRLVETPGNVVAVHFCTLGYRFEDTELFLVLKDG